MKEALELILKEREHQIELGYNREHDDKHINEELANAAASYALSPKLRSKLAINESSRIMKVQIALGKDKELCPPIIIWPFEKEYFKPKPDNRLRELAIAGAFIIAEIERLMAKEPTKDKII